MTLQVVHARVDAWVFAFRVELAGGLVGVLEQAARTKGEGHAALVEWGELAGELTYAGAGKWVVQNARYVVVVQPRAPGSRKRDDGTQEAGWTVEVKWFAQGAADLSPAEVYPLTRALAVTLGHVHEARTRRIDLAADVAGYELRDEDGRCFVKRPRARLSEYAFARDGRAGENDADAALEKEKPQDRQIVRHFLSKITGFSVCPGGWLMARIYDKRAHLQLLQEETRVAEEARWREGGWSGGDEPITRVEFQLRGQVLSEFGIRDPEAPYDPGAYDRETGEVRSFEGLHETFDRIWRACLGWLSLRVENVDDEQRSRWALDPRWAVLYEALFVAPTRETHRRLRVRKGATTEMAYGCVLSILGRVDGLDALRTDAPKEDDDAIAAVHAHVSELFAQAGVLAGEHFVAKWGGRDAWTHIASAQNATRARLSDPLRPVRAVPRGALDVAGDAHAAYDAMRAKLRESIVERRRMRGVTPLAGTKPCDACDGRGHTLSAAEAAREAEARAEDMRIAGAMLEQRITRIREERAAVA